MTTRTPPHVDYRERIVVDPMLQFGKPTIRGTRITVAKVLNLLAHGASWDQIVADFPVLSKDDIQAAMLYAGIVLGDWQDLLAEDWELDISEDPEVDQLLARVSTNPEMLGGQPAVTNTRIPVTLILNLIRNGYSFDRIVEAYPDLTAIDIRAALAYAETRLHAKEIRVLPAF